jgi:uncharacterized damage-inducible protein DinB
VNISDHLRMLIAYDGWATDRLLEKTQDLVEQDAGPGASWGSIEGSMRHVLNAHGTWLSRFTGRPSPPAQGEGFAALAVYAGDIHERLVAFGAGLTDAAVFQEVHFQDSRGNPHHDFLAVLLGHLVNHGTYHRGEAALLLTRMGRSPGDLDLVVYRRLTEPGR